MQENKSMHTGKKKLIPKTAGTSLSTSSNPKLKANKLTAKSMDKGDEAGKSTGKKVLGDIIGDDPESALADIEEKIHNEPDNEEHYIVKYQILKKLGAWQEIVETLEFAESFSDNPYFPLKLAEFYEERSGYEKAIPCRLSAIKLGSDDFNNRRRLALDYVRVNDYDAAQECFEYMLTTFPDQSLGHTFFQEMQGVGLGKKERSEQIRFGIKIASKYLKQSPQNVTLLEGMARLARINRDFQLAIDYYEKLLKAPDATANSNNRQWKTELLRLYAREGFTDKWTELNERLILDFEVYLASSGNTDANAWLQLALLQIQGGLFEEAILSLKSCLELDSKNIQALYELGRIYIRLDRSDEAIEYYNSILPADGELSGRMKYHRALELCLADLYYRLGRFEEALELYKREQNANYRYIGLVLEAMGDISAIDYYRRAIENSSKDGRNYLALAEYYVRRANWTEAERLAKDGLNCPHITRDANEQLYVVLATTMMKTGRIKEALAVIDEAIEAANEPFSMELRKIKLLFMSGDPATAKRNGIDLIKKIEKQLSCAPSASNLWTILGDLASILSQFELARKAYSEAIKYNALDSDAVRGEGVLAEKFGEIDKALQLFKKYTMLEPLSLATPALRAKIQKLQS